ncbi:MFS transporter [Pararobbsia alpina]|uniref:MFS transporter n=1 Tax=Pararobbsia alpina TaxID=621374 RepID=UPI0039A4FD2A
MSHSPPQRGRARLTFALLCVMAFIMYVDRTNMSVAAPVMSKELGFTNTHLGLIFSAFALAYSVFMIPGGWHSDRIGSRKGMLLYGAIWSVATIATGLISSFVMLVVARFAVGLGEAPIYPTAARMIARVIPEEQRGTALGAMHATGRVANALAPLIVTALIIAFSWRMTFIILGAVTLVYMAVMYTSLSESKRQAETAVGGVGAAGAQNDAALGSRTANAASQGSATQGSASHASSTHAAANQAHVSRPVDWVDMLKRVWPAAAACFCHGWVLWFFLNWIPSFFSQRYGLKLEHNAVFSALVLLGGSLGTAAGGVLTDWRFKRTGNRLRARREVIIFGFLVSILGLVPLLITHDVVISACSLGFAFFCSELADSPLWVVGTEVSREHSATSAACTFTGMAIAGAVSPVVVGTLLDMSGGNWAVAFGASIVVLLLGPVFTMRIRLDDGPPTTPPSTERSRNEGRPLSPPVTEFSGQVVHAPSQ